MNKNRSVSREVLEHTGVTVTGMALANFFDIPKREINWNDRVSFRVSFSLQSATSFRGK